MPRAFVTGVAGFLGSHVAEHFLGLGWDVSGIDNLVGGDLANLPEGLRFERADCLDSPSSSVPVMSGIRWSVTTNATLRPRSARSASIDNASAPEVAKTTR